MHAPQVTIVLPTQGGRPSLVPALRSALAQRFASFEVLVVDDNPGGSMWRLQPQIAALLHDRRVRIASPQRGVGCAAAKNAGLREARGTWVCYLDDDNLYDRDKIAAQHARAEQTGSPVVLCGLEIVPAEARPRLRQVKATEFRGDALLLDAIADTNVLFHRRDAGVFWNEALGTVDDACFFHALIERFGLETVPNVPQPLVTYHAHAGPRANRGLERFYRGQRHLLVRWAPRYSPAARRRLWLRSLVAFEKYRHRRWGRFIRLALRLLREGGFREARYIVNAAGVKIPALRRWLVT